MKIVLILILALSMACQDNRQSEREQMVQFQIQNRGISDKLVLDAFRNVERHKFVPDEYTSMAYEDTPLPIGYGQTISQPYIVAFMTESIKPQINMKVLEIGTGSGYQAAILAEIGCEVYSVEIVDELAKQATRVIESMNYSNVHIKSGDGYLGWEEHSPYDAIIVTAAPESIPAPLLEQLKNNGRLVIPVGPQYQTQNLLLVEKVNGKVNSKVIAPVRFVPFIRK
ncbi:MAG TPA: protein-L-isoaspartate(D-aspartate) O-methyltransferase [Salinivirgaceae bacterium]|nr:protein-L-isoaspartate(D-aspartate) O-methyltransferase [Salinivirgaceae bacterium]